MSRISLIRFMDGGAAMFAAVEINHQRDREGRRVSKPLERKRLRVFVVS